MMSMSRLVSITLLATLITACGQKGPLVLPDGAKPRDAHTRPADEKPAADTPSSKRQTSGEQTSDDAPATPTDDETTIPSGINEH